ncbi:aldo/keto reductase [Oleiagrimonas sp. C23AA]|uniref:aldo/keto reductase n=1 Tax=Oleiagrimonas sp. C23AA TaxID=2719047 RepID=UPI00142041E5|nr:aldo/keto reductase [Oleiagrimonas sp. C23AA]NII11270.1 aldo/keto reductase [Oleiagrimonas sp. C23AA]
MDMRTIGKSELSVAPLAFGGNVFGWTADEKRSFELLDRFVDAGFNLIDTADVYSRWADGNQGGESETILGKWLAQSGKRDKIVLATKVGKWEPHPGLSADNIRAAVDDSLKRLQTDHIDLYQSHAFDENTPQAETLAAYGELIEQGKVRVIGASNFSARQLNEALDIAEREDLPRYEALQPEYNLLERAGYEADLEPLIRERKVGVISYFSLAAGFLTGKYRSDDDLEGRQRKGMVGKYMNAHGKRVLRALDDVAKRHDTQPVQVALAWLMARPGITAPIASATSLEQLEQLIESTQLKLDEGDIEALNSASGGA